MKLKTLLFSVLCLSLIALAGGCSDDSDGTTPSTDTGSGDTTTTFTWPANTGEVVNTYAEIVKASYADSVATAQTLDGALEALVNAPSEANLTAARDAWLASREPYLQTEVYRFYNGPIDNEDNGPEGLLNAWPLDENYIDYVKGDAAAGIVNGSETIDASTLESLNEKGGEANIATGYHAIEFLLWGQDMSETGAGNRSYIDYMDNSDPSGCYSGPPSHQCTCGGAEMDCAAPGVWKDTCNCPINADRRGTYLTVAGDLLITHLLQVHDAWDAGSATDYVTGFKADTAGAIEKILTGMIILSGFETGGERLQAALDSKNQEDEHSCFSDNTHRDMVQDVQGVWNVWAGTYTRTDGTKVEGAGIKDIVTAVNADLATKVDIRITESLALAKALQIPFDKEIAEGNTEGNARVEALVMSLLAQEKELEEVFDLFGLTIPVAE